MEKKHTQFRIIADSSANLTGLEHIPFASVPLKIITAEKEYVDVAGMDVAGMLADLKSYKGRSSSSCPNAEEWLNAFGDAEYVFGVTITSGLSGAYNAAQAAKQIYEAEHPSRHVFIVDSLSTGPEAAMLVEKLEELILAGLPFGDICKEIKAYQHKTGLLFMLKSLTNFANNGRVKPAVAKLAGVLGICIVGKASAEGTLEPMDKCRGQRKSIAAILQHLKESGYRGGRLRIAHVCNEEGAMELRNRILEAFPTSDIKICSTMALCSFYAEEGGLLVGYEANG